MINENIYQPETSADQDEKIRKEFVEFIDANEFTSDQMCEAYYQLCGVSENKEQDPAVEKIFKKMNEMVENSFPLDKLAELIGLKQNYENAVPDYYQCIDNLNISYKEKNVLRSIVEKKRSGEIEFFVDDRIIANFKIKRTDTSIEILAIKLKNVIQEIIKRAPQNKKFKFMFTED